jgi:5'-nucleotidase
MMAVKKLDSLRLIPAVLAAALLFLGGCSQPQTVPDDEQTAEPVTVKLFAFNDFHGNLKSPGTVSVDGEEEPAGGVAYMKAHIDRLTGEHPHAMVVAAGDLIGASPLISAVFHDEPTMLAMGLLGLDVSSVGNHEFDRGWQELVRLDEGGCHPEEGCKPDEEYAGAPFPYLAANVLTEDDDTLFPGYQVETFDDVPVGIIGLVLSDAPSVISPEAIEGLSFADEAEVINGVVEKLQKEGVETFVVLIHEGGRPTAEQASFDDCGDLEGPIVDIVEQTDSAVDVFVTGHSHQTYICTIDGALVTSAMSYGRLLTEIDLTIDRDSNDVVASATNHVVDHDVEPDAELAALVSRFDELSADVANREVGTITDTISRAQNDAGESALGDVIADVQLAATSAPDKGGAQIALMNPGGIRASLEADEDADGDQPVTFADLHRVQPFGNRLMTMTLTGRQIHQVLEAQWSGSHPKILQVSQGFTYTWSESPGADGERIDPASMKLAGEPIDLDADYRVTVNSFLASGGDGFATLKEGTDRRAGPIDLDAFATYMEENAPLEPGPQDRIQVVTGEEE